MKKVKILFLMMVMCLMGGLNALAQTLVVKGTITDASNGDPVPFATVVVEGTSVWATTQSDGTYEIDSPVNGVLAVSILGYAETKVNVDGRKEVNIQLAPEFDALSESVVIGYGVQQKKLVTGSTIQVKGDDLTRLSTNSALGALQSQSPGVQITQNSGQPGQGFKVNIRGIGTIGDSSVCDRWCCRR